MAIKINVPTPMRQHTGGKSQVEATGATVQAALDDLSRQFPGVADRLFEKPGQLRRFVNIYLNDEDIRYLDSLNTVLKDGDELAIIPAVAGG
jgi:molybdopterin synthase sulfur carrier subunit